MYTIYDADITILINAQTGEVAIATMDPPHLRPTLMREHPGTLPLTGPIARLLFRALSGRKFEETPEQASQQRAYEAREALSSLFMDECYGLAMWALNVHGPDIDPDLGLVRLDEQGFPIVEEVERV